MAATFEELWARAEGGDEDAIFALVAGFDKANRPRDSLSVLMRAAQRGNVLARLTIGARAIAGAVPQLTLNQALALIEGCARQGNKQAAEMMAALISIDYAPGGMEGALAALERAAEMGASGARDQLSILASLRKAASVDSLLEAPAIRWLSQSPRIGVIAGFLDDQVCDWLIKRAAPRLRRARVYADDGVSGQFSGARTNTSADFTPTELDVLMGLLWRRVASTAGLPLNQFETFTVLHYAPGEAFEPHYDFSRPDSSNHPDGIGQAGQRVLTFLVYLNDNYENGETAFPRLDIAHKGRRGDALFFFNVGPDGQPDLQTLHAGRPPTRGEKWLTSIFVRDKPISPGAAPG